MEFPFANFISGKLYVSVSSVRVVVESVDIVVPYGGECIVNVAWNGIVRRQVDKKRSSNIQFTREVEKNGELFFLVCLVSRDDYSLRTTVYRKQTQETRYHTKPQDY